MNDSESKNTIQFDLAQIIATTVASHLSVWLKDNKNVIVTTDELLAALNVPKVGPAKKQPIKTPAAVPVYFKEPSSVKGKKVVKGKGKSKEKKENSVDQCIYTFTRGKNLNDQCSKAVAGPGHKGGDKYCKSCLNKKAVKDILNNGEGEPDIVRQPVVKSNPPVNDITDPNVLEWQVERYVGEQQGMMYHPETGFVIKQISDGDPVVIGKDIDKTGEWIALTLEEEEKAIGLGFCVQSKDEEQSSMSDIAGL